MLPIIKKENESGCVEFIFGLKMIVAKDSEEVRNLLFVVVDFEFPYNRVNRKNLYLEGMVQKH